MIGGVELGIILLYGLAMLVGLVGVVVPGLPGLLLVAVVTGVWAYDQDEQAAWVVFGVVLVVLLVGTVAKYVLPSRTLKAAGAPLSTLLLALVLAVVGFFVIPVVGLLIGGVLGAYVGELLRLRDAGAARRSTIATAKALGLGMLLELIAGVLAVAIWFSAALVMQA
jgi:uncharacterized protein YqgC (DUF456 family)